MSQKVWKITQSKLRIDMLENAREVLFGPYATPYKANIFMSALYFTVRYHDWVKANHPDFQSKERINDDG